MVIILFNFLINILQHSFDETMTRKRKYIFVQRAILNQDYRIQLSFRAQEELIHCDLIILSGSADSQNDQNDNEWNGYVQSIRNYIITDGWNMLSKFRNRLSESNETMNDKVLAKVE